MATTQSDRSEMDDGEETVTNDREGQETGDNHAEPAEMGDSSSGESQKQKKPSELEILRQQLKEANSESATRRHRIKELEDQIKAKERAEMDEVERLKAELADLSGADGEREALKAQLATYETAVQAQVDQLRASLNIPDHIGELLEEKSAAEQLQYLVKNQAQLQPEPKRKPEFDSDKKGKNSGKPSKDKEARREKLAKRMRLNRR